MKTSIYTRYFVLRTLMMIAITGLFLRVKGQVDQRIVMANKYFDAGEYFTAADLYEQYLNPVKKEVPKANFPINTRRYGQGGGSVNKFDIIYRQAESYRLANYWTEAAEKYKECFEKDEVKYADAYYWYAVCQRSLGNYTSAEEYLDRFEKQNTGSLIPVENAKEEAATIRFIKEQLARPDTVLFTVKKTETNFSHEKGIFALTGIGSNNYIYATTIKSEQSTNGESPNHSRMFFGTIDNGVLGNPMMIETAGAEDFINQGAATISPDKQKIYFTQWKKVNGKNVSTIFYSVMENGKWAKPVEADLINKDGYNSKQPYFSQDGKTIYFSSDMPGGYGGFDIWSVKINSDGTFGSPVNAGVLINTEGEEQAPFFHTTTNTLVFASNGKRGMGGFDLYAAKWNGDSFKSASNMGNPVNSSRDDIYFYAPEGKEILANSIVGSDRGSECCLESYAVIKAPKKKTISGLVLDCKTNQPAGNANIMLRDAAGKMFQVTTSADGKYSFDISTTTDQLTFNIVKENYQEKTVNASIESINTNDYLVDILTNAALCIDPIIKEEKKLVIKVENVVTLYFDFDKSSLKPREKEILDSIYSTLVANQTYTIQISGYTDGLGTDEYNKILSDKRAKACADYLIAKGLDPERISFVSFGECCPVEMELINGRDNPDGRKMNRRALINISKEE